MTTNIPNTALDSAAEASIPASTQETAVGDPNQHETLHSSKSKPSERFQSIQILRAIAAIAVVLFHVREYLKIIGGVEQSIFSIFTEVFANGATLFFCISGFLMAHLITTGYRHFLPRRLLRIYPTFFIAVALALALRTLAFGTIPQPDLLAALSLLPLGRIAYPLNIEWTLVYEVFFYLICTIFTFHATRKLFPIFLGGWLIAIIAMWMMTDTPQLALPTIETIFFQAYNIYFIAGGLTYYVTRLTPPLPKAACFVVTLVIAGSIATWPLLKTNSLFSKYETFIFAIYATAILLVALSIKTGAPDRAMQIMIKLGDYSYGIYLIHVPVIVTIFYYYTLHVGALSSKVALFALVASIVCGCYLGKLDVRLHRWVSSKIFRPSHRPDLAVARARGRIW